jgi:ArsR family transcriptional regulator, arsenate/arsenite/antimonite-responsive transcriptional repressor
MGWSSYREKHIPMPNSRKSGVTTKAPKRARLDRAQRALILKALADPRRFELLQQIAKAGCPLGCSQALAALPISAATLSHHIKELETAGLIEVRREGKFAYLTLRPGVLGSLAAGLNALEPASCPGS